jgi:hypothetical protein
MPFVAKKVKMSIVEPEGCPQVQEETADFLRAEEKGSCGRSE